MGWVIYTCLMSFTLLNIYLLLALWVSSLKTTKKPKYAPDITVYLWTFWNHYPVAPTVLFLLLSTLVNMLSVYVLIFISICFYLYMKAYSVVEIVDGELKISRYPLQWYVSDIKKWTDDYIFKGNMITVVLSYLAVFIDNLRYFFHVNVNDILVAFCFSEAPDDCAEWYEEIYQFQKRVFKFKKPENPKKGKFKGSDEEWEKLLWSISENSNPLVMLNSLSRLPLYLKFDISEDSKGKFLWQNGLVFYNFFKSTLVAITLMLLYFLYTVFFFKVQFLKQLSVWFVIGMLFFWLISGFNFFLKRYQYGKFTSAMQSFWKRTNTCFWLIEGFLILIFFYYYLNSSQEPVYMYDYSALNQEYLVSLQAAGLNVIVLSLVIYFMYFTMFSLNSNSWVQLNVYLMMMSVFIFFSFFIETYQFYYVISTFNERLWVFNEEENLWLLDMENPTLSNKHQYLLICLMAKYWHFLFIFLSWVFFLMKSFERRKVTFVLFGANLQNMVLLYVLNFACYVQWFKWMYSRFMDLPYTWFMTNIDSKFVFSLFVELRLLVVNMLGFNTEVFSYNNLIYKSLNNWNVDSLALWKFV